MTTREREPNESLDYVLGRLEGVVESIQDVKAGQMELARRIDRVEERVDKLNGRMDKLILAIVGVGGGILVTIIGGMIGLGWLIVRAG